MTKDTQAIGLLGGTFDPIHNGHIEIANRVLRDLHFSTVQLIPNKVPPHRTQPIASDENRLAMARLAVAKQKNIIVNDIEMQRTGPSYTVDTLHMLREQDPTQPLCLIVGEDIFNIFNQWHQWQQIPNLAHLVVINRPHLPMTTQPWMQELLAQRETTNAQALTQQIAGKIFFYTMEPLNISAQEIRSKLATGQDVTDKLNPEVLRYIQQMKLYSVLSR